MKMMIWYQTVVLMKRTARLFWSFYDVILSSNMALSGLLHLVLLKVLQLSDFHALHPVALASNTASILL